MEYSVVNFKNVKEIQDFRIDAECFQPIHLQTEDLIKKTKYETLGMLSKSVINFGAYSLCNYIEFISEGIPFIMTQDIKNNLIDTDNLHFISKEVHRILYKSHCKFGQVLLTMAGAYLGQAAVYYLDFEASSNQAIAKITLRETTIDPFYLSTFLNCKFGQSQITRFRTGTGQPNLNLGLIQTIKVPLLSANFQSLTKNLVLDGIKCDKERRECYVKADQMLTSELGIQKWELEYKLSFVKNFSNTHSAGRIDAEYFQPVYDVIVGAVKSAKGFACLGDLVSIKKCVEPGSEAYQDSGVPFVRVSNLSKFGINNDNQQFISESLYESLKIHQPKKGEILLSKDATPGIAYYLIDAPSKMIPSSGILQLTVKDPLKTIPQYLTLVLNSVVVQKQIERDVGGSVINHWLVDQVKNTIIPVLDEPIQKAISSKISESFLKHQQSRLLLEIAKHGTEIAIESGEEKAKEWINQEVKAYAQLLY
jgi:type I restriction enzyme, S subunit